MSMSNSWTARGVRLAATLTDYHRCLAIINGAGMEARGSVNGHLGCCEVLDDITAAFEDIKTESPPKDSSNVYDYSNVVEAVIKRMRARERGGRR